MALNTCEMWFNGIKIAFFSKNLQKSHHGLWFRPHTPKASVGCPPPPPPPQTPSVIPLSYTSFLNTFPKLDICAVQLLVLALSLCKILVKCQQATISDLPSYDIFVPQKIPLLKIVDDVIACDFWFGSPSIKNSGYACELEIAWKTFLKTFFFRTLSCGCVLGPWF